MYHDSVHKIYKQHGVIGTYDNDRNVCERWEYAEMNKDVCGSLTFSPSVFFLVWIIRDSLVVFRTRKCMFFARRRAIAMSFISKSLVRPLNVRVAPKWACNKCWRKRFFASNNPTSHESNCCNIENVVENKSHACHRNTFNPINRTFEPSPIHVIACSELFFFLIASQKNRETNSSYTSAFVFGYKFWN